MSATIASRRGTGRRAPTVLLAIALVSVTGAPARGGPFADSVVSFAPGSGAGFGADQLPGIVLGPPRGGGELQGSLDVLSLGNDGVIVLGFDPPVICDGPGPDLTVFENPFHSGSIDGPIFAEYGIVAVSQDGVHFVTFPYDPASHVGLAGQNPVLSNPDNGIDPLDPSVSGGDQFDLADVGLTWAKYVRITDPGVSIDDPGNHVPPGTQAGFDLDALAALHACDPSTASSPSPTPTPTPGQTALPGDVDGDGVVDADDLRQLIDELFDGDGDLAGDVGGGTVHSGPGVDVNGDGRINAADLTALQMHRSP